MARAAERVQRSERIDAIPDRAIPQAVGGLRVAYGRTATGRRMATSTGAGGFVNDVRETGKHACRAVNPTFTEPHGAAGAERQRGESGNGRARRAWVDGDGSRSATPGELLTVKKGEGLRI